MEFIKDRSKRTVKKGLYFTKNSDVISKKQTIVKSADTTQVINERLEKEWHQN
jgi:hypothetical protein